MAASPPSEAVDLSPQPFPAAPPGFVIRAVLALRRFLLGLADRVVPAHVAIFERSTGVAQTQLLGAAARHGLADLLADGPLSAEELAARTGCNADALHRTMRALACGGIFALDGNGRFRNNRLSLPLRSGTLARAREWVQYFSSKSNVDAWCDHERTLTSGHNAFERVHGMSVWEWFDAHPDERELFAQAMMGLTVGEAPVVAALYPFREIRRLCDVGGGRGTLLSELLIRHPHLQGVLCDGAGVIESARVLLARRGVAARVELAAGNFFAAVPSGCDAYLMKNILHDWDDARCQQILDSCRRAMAPGARLLLVELLQERNDASGLGPLADVQMMIVCSDGRERGREEFARLVRSAGMRLERVFAAPTVAVLEAVAV